MDKFLENDDQWWNELQRISWSPSLIVVCESVMSGLVGESWQWPLGGLTPPLNLSSLPPAASSLEVQVRPSLGEPVWRKGWCLHSHKEPDSAHKDCWHANWPLWWAEPRSPPKWLIPEMHWVLHGDRWLNPHRQGQQDSTINVSTNGTDGSQGPLEVNVTFRATSSDAALMRPSLSVAIPPPLDHAWCWKAWFPGEPRSLLGRSCMCTPTAF